MLDKEAFQQAMKEEMMYVKIDEDKEIQEVEWEVRADYFNQEQSLEEDGNVMEAANDYLHRTKASISFNLTKQIAIMCEQTASTNIGTTAKNEEDGNLMEAEVVDIVAPSQDIDTTAENQDQVVDIAAPS
ncbi:hypothetical protein Tco_0317309 [Tanacetum coccineum]